MDDALPLGEPVSAPAHNIPFREAFWVWVKVAIFSFGGPAGQMAMMHRILVEEKRWVSESRFLHALNYTMMLPGPEAQQLTIYIGWLLHRARGGIVAGTLFVLPGFASILLLSILYAGFRDVTLVQALFFGLKPAVMAVVVQAVIHIGRRALKNSLMVALAVLAFIGLFFFDVPFPLIIVAAGLIGFLGVRFWPAGFSGEDETLSGSQLASATAESEAVISDTSMPTGRPSLARSLKVIAICLTLWFGPLLGLVLLRGEPEIFLKEGIFFSQAAVVTFGGAYAVLAYIAQEAVNTFQWLMPGEMLDGLGMAETTPGPLIQVVQFVGFMGAFRNPGPLNPMLAGILGSILTTWVTFVPCFLWIFLGAPYIEALRGNRSLNSALSAITAAVVGVVFNLAVWFSINTVFGSVAEVNTFGLRLLVPDLATLDLASLLIAAGAFVAMFRFKTTMIPTLTGAALVGLLVHLAFRS